LEKKKKTDVESGELGSRTKIKSNDFFSSLSLSERGGNAIFHAWRRASSFFLPPSFFFFPLF